MDKTQVYLDKINQVIDYIDLNLSQKLDLEELSRVACLSKYHFHRIFHSFTGEPLYAFINRLRLEKAAGLLISQETSITAIAMDCGFQDSATFSRAFKKHFQTSANLWKKLKKSKFHQETSIKTPYTIQNKMSDNLVIKTISTEIKSLEETAVAYIRYTGPYAGNGRLFHDLQKKLMQWALPQNLVHYPETKHIIIYHDPLGITNDEKLRVSFGITIPASLTVKKSGGGKLLLEAGRYLITTFDLKPYEYGKAWTFVYRHIIPQKGLEVQDGYCFERYMHDCYDPKTDLTRVSICVPVK